MSYRARILSAYQSASPDPLMAQVGDPMTIGGRDEDWPGWIHCTDRRGKTGWVPEKYLELRDGKGVMKCDYYAGELSVEAGDPVTVEGEESGWAWCTNASGSKGWLPDKVIERI
jgi:uncharacterized protein YgiM (DUF1202 family)